MIKFSQFLEEQIHGFETMWVTSPDGKGQTKTAYQVPRHTISKAAANHEHPRAFTSYADRKKLDDALPHHFTGDDDTTYGSYKKTLRGAMDHAYKIGRGNNKHSLSLDTMNKIASRHTKFKNGMEDKNKDSEDFVSTTKHEFEKAMAAAHAHGKLDKNK